MRGLYTVLFYLALPFILLRLLWRSRKLPGYRKRLSERFGFTPYELKGAIWIHAVSVGETLAAIPFMKAIQQAYPAAPLVVTNMTPTGAERVRAAFGDRVKQLYIPYDLPFALERWVKRINPRILIILETELWPNLLHVCYSHQIPIMIANARLSEKSWRGYQRLRGFTNAMLQKITLLASQGVADAERFIRLGLPQDKVQVTGNLKFDLEIPADLFSKGEALRETIGINRPVWIAASTHAGEEEIILAAHQKIIAAYPTALLILVPRHPDRFEAVAQMIAAHPLKFVRRSQGGKVPESVSVYLGDTMGELLLLYAASDIAFVGGSFAPIGGHNLLEPAALKKAVLSGPVLFNFAEISQKLLLMNALTLTQDQATLAKTVVELMGDVKRRDVLGEAAYQVVLDNRGALKKQLILAESLLEKA